MDMYYMLVSALLDYRIKETAYSTHVEGYRKQNKT